MFSRALPDLEKAKLANVVNAALRATKEDAWDALFAGLEITIAGSKLKAGEIEGGNDWIARRFELPEDAYGTLFGSLVRVTLSFRSVAPKAVNRYRISFLETTLGCNCQITVHYPTSYMEESLQHL